MQVMDKLLRELPAELSYRLEIKKDGYRYFCRLEVDSNNAIVLESSSNDLAVAMDTVLKDLGRAMGTIRNYGRSGLEKKVM